MKNNIIIALAVMSIILLLSNLGSCSNAYKQKTKKDKEMSLRLDLEEKLNNVAKEKATYEAKIKSISEELAAEKNAHEATKKSLLQEQLVSQGLKEEIQKILKDQQKENQGKVSKQKK